MARDVVVLDAGEEHLQRDSAGDGDRDPADHPGRGLAVELEPADGELPRDGAAAEPRTTASTSQGSSALTPMQQQSDADDHLCLVEGAVRLVDSAQQRGEQHGADDRQGQPPPEPTSTARGPAYDAERLDDDPAQRELGHPDRGGRHRQRDECDQHRIGSDVASEDADARR